MTMDNEQIDALADALEAVKASMHVSIESVDVHVVIGGVSVADHGNTVYEVSAPQTENVVQFYSAGQAALYAYALAWRIETVGGLV
jgi:molybdopterin biosynthesis enzyme